ncbi:hypothetical protein ABIE89_005196 [Bradyrhizobium niftali]|jgi:hypothetical protein
MRTETRRDSRSSGSKEYFYPHGKAYVETLGEQD